MAPDTPMAICLAASVADNEPNDAKSADDAESQGSDSQEGTSLMDAYKEVLNSQVSNFECFAK